MGITISGGVTFSGGMQFSQSALYDWTSDVNGSFTPGTGSYTWNDTSTESFSNCPINTTDVNDVRTYFDSFNSTTGADNTSTYWHTAYSSTGSANNADANYRQCKMIYTGGGIQAIWYNTNNNRFYGLFFDSSTSDKTIDYTLLRDGWGISGYPFTGGTFDLWGHDGGDSSRTVKTTGVTRGASNEAMTPANIDGEYELPFWSSTTQNSGTDPSNSNIPVYLHYTSGATAFHGQRVRLLESALRWPINSVTWNLLASTTYGDGTISGLRSDGSNANYSRLTNGNYGPVGTHGTLPIPNCN